MTEGPDEHPSWDRDTEPTEAGAARDRASSGEAGGGAADAADGSGGTAATGGDPATAGAPDSGAAGAGETGAEVPHPGIPDSVSAFDLLPSYEGGLTGPSLTRKPPEGEQATRREHPPTGPDNEVVTNVVDEVPVSAGDHSAFRDVFGDLAVAEDDADVAASAGRRAERAPAPGPRRRGSAPAAPRRRTGILTLCIVLALLVLVGLFALGTQLPRMLGAAPAPTPTRTHTPTPAPTPTVTPVPASSQQAGTHRWNTLGGGECLDPFDSPWTRSFTVVDCSAPHAAQLVATGLLSTKIGDAYPGDDDVAAAAAKECDANGVIDLKAAGDYSDLQVQASYPATEKQWDAGEREYYCVASLESGKQLTGSVAGSDSAG